MNETHPIVGHTDNVCIAADHEEDEGEKWDVPSAKDKDCLHNAPKTKRKVYNTNSLCA